MERYEAAPRRTRTKTSAMAKATSARPGTSSKVEPPLLGSCVLALAVGLVIALAVELVAIAEPLEEALAEPLGEALGEALAVGLAEPLEEALAEALAPLTVTVAVI